MQKLRTYTVRWFKLVGGLSIIGAFMVMLSPGAAIAASPTAISFHAWNSNTDFASGQFDSGAKLAPFSKGITLKSGATTGIWTSQSFSPGVPINQLVTSWQADTPSGSWIETQLSVKVDGHWSTWYNMGKWAFDSTAIQRTSVPDQADDDGAIYVDTYFSNVHAATEYKLREVLHGTNTAKPTVRQVAATASDPKPADATTSATTMPFTIDLPVPQFSQETHQGEYPQYDGGGEAWCSPTSTAMVLKYWHHGPSQADLATLPADPVFDAHGRKDAEVDYAAQRTFDADYEGTGNWPFNTAFASHYGLDGSVRQFNSLRGAEEWIRKGTPLVVSINWDNTDARTDNDLTGASIPKTGGHLMVIRGFTKQGEVIANDPAAPSNAAVKRTYQRGQFERNWQNASSGATYVIKPAWING